MKINSLIKQIKKTLYDLFVLIEIRKFKLSNKKLLEPKSISKSNIPVYFINLDRSIDRKKSVLPELKKYFKNYNRIEAVDGKTITNSLFTNKTNLFKYDLEEFKNDKNISSSVIGCLLSHMKTIDKIQKDKCEYALVIEDDVSLRFINQWGITLDEIVEEAPEDFEVLKIHSYKTLQNLKLLNKNVKYRKLDREPNKEWSAAAYILSNKGVENAMSYIKNQTFSFNKMDSKMMVADYFLWRINKTYDFTQPLIYSVDHASTLGTKDHQQRRLNKYLKTLYNFNLPCHTS